MTKDDKKSRISKSSIPRTHSAGAARRGDRDYAAGRALRRMEALNVRKMETDENSSGALVAGENGGGSHRLQSSGSVRGPLMQISISKSDCTENCNRSNCGFLFDDRLNYSDANMVCVSVDDEMEGEPPSKTQQISGGGGENVRLRRRVRERKRTSKGEAQNTKKPRPAVAEEDKENSGAAASIPVLGESGSGKTQTILGRSSKVGGWAFCGRTPCLLVWLRRRTLEEAPSGQSTGAQGGTRVCLLGEYEFNRPWPEPESLSASREGHWGSIISILPFLLENVTSLLE
jgi:hypothetical protein